MSYAFDELREGILELFAEASRAGEKRGWAAYGELSLRKKGSGKNLGIGASEVRDRWLKGMQHRQPRWLEGMRRSGCYACEYCGSTSPTHRCPVAASAAVPAPVVLTPIVLAPVVPITSLARRSYEMPPVFRSCVSCGSRAPAHRCPATKMPHAI